MTESLPDRVAIVTGAADGPKASLGAAFARALAEAGARVIVADLSDTASVVADIETRGGSALGVPVDMRKRASVQALIEAATARFGHIDILVNNAAVGSNIPPVPLGEFDAAAWDEVMAVNVRGALWAVQATAPVMAARHYGKIINIGSPMVADGTANRLHYVASKGALHAMTRALARELGPQGIRAYTLTPGYPLTPFTRRALDANPALEQRLMNTRSIPQHITPDQICSVLTFLASAASDAMTGQHLVVDNGSQFV